MFANILSALCGSDVPFSKSMNNLIIIRIINCPTARQTLLMNSWSVYRFQLIILHICLLASTLLRTELSLWISDKPHAGVIHYSLSRPYWLHGGIIWAKSTSETNVKQNKPVEQLSRAFELPYYSPPYQFISSFNSRPVIMWSSWALKELRDSVTLLSVIGKTVPNTSTQQAKKGDTCTAILLESIFNSS